MATVYSAIIEGTTSSSWWLTSYAGELSAGDRDTKYGTRVYATIVAWEAARDGDSSGGDTEVAIISGPWTAADTNLVGFQGWNAKTQRVECPLTVPSGTNPARHNGIYGDVSTAYRLEYDGIVIYDYGTDGNTTTFDGLQVKNSGTSDLALFQPSSSGTGTWIIKNCVIRNDYGTPIYIYNTGWICKTENTVVWCGGSQAGASEGIYYSSSASGSWMYCNTICNFNDGIELDAGGNAVIKNTAVFNNADDFDIHSSSTRTIDYNASDDGDGTNAVNWNSEATDWAANFTDYANGDFTPLNADLVGAGVGPSVDGNVPTTDIIGNPRSGTTCTIGAFEYQAAVQNLSINIAQSIGVTHTIGKSMPLGNIGLIQSITLAELRNLLIQGLNLTVSQAQALTTSELIQMALELKLSGSQNIALSELLNAALNLAQISKSQGITIQQAIIAAINLGSILQSDSILITELISLAMKLADIAAAQNIEVSEAITMVLAGDNFISKSDIIQITELISAIIDLANISGVQNIDIHEVISSIMDLGLVSETQTISISELSNILIEIEALFAQQLISLAESIAAAMNIPELNLQESISIGELINIFVPGAGEIAAFQQIAILENSILQIPVALSVLDTISIFESAMVSMGIVIDKTETIDISETYAIAFALLPYLNQPISIAELISVIRDAGIILGAEGISVGEMISIIFSGFNVATTQNISISELISIIIGYMITGKVSAIFLANKPNTSWTASKPAASYGSKKPSITFTGE